MIVSNFTRKDLVSITDLQLFWARKLEFARWKMRFRKRLKKKPDNRLFPVKWKQKNSKLEKLKGKNCPSTLEIDLVNSIKC